MQCSRTISQQTRSLPACSPRVRAFSTNICSPKCRVYQRCNSIQSEKSLATDPSNTSSTSPIVKDGSSSLWFKSLMSAPVSFQPSMAVAVAVPLLVLGFMALGTDPAEAAQPRFELSEEADFFSNVARYGRFFVTVMLGTVSVMTRPLAGLFKNPLTGILAIAALVGGGIGMKITLEAMLGMSEAQEYVPGAVAGFQ